MSPDDALHGRIINRVLTISGNNPSIRVDGGCLVVADGPMLVPANHRGPAPPAKERMVTHRFRRADCPVDRIVATRPDGFITFAALKWLHGVGCGIVQLDYDGTVIFASSPAGPDQPALRRVQALAAGDEIGVAVMREILRVKLKGQAEVARLLGSEETAGLIVRLAGEVAGARDGAQILAIEATAAVAYWALWRDLPVQFARQYEVPEHWRTFGPRRSPLTGKPFRAATPGCALLHYLYRTLESEMVIGLLGVGLDPGIAIFHLDRDRRSSLALDAIEAVRPYVDCWLAAWLAASRFAKRDFVELEDGEIRITRPLTSHLAMSGPIWRQAATAVSGWLAQSFGRVAGADGMRIAAGGIIPVAQKLPPALTRSSRLFPPLSPPLPAFLAPSRAHRPAALKDDPIPRTCHECGRALPLRRRKFCCEECATSYYRDTQFHAIVAAIASRRADPKRSRAANLAIGKKASRNAASRHAWRSRPEWSETDDEAMRRWYADAVCPAVTRCKLAAIMRATGLSKQFSITIRAGRRTPHPRHFAALAKLAGVPVPKALTPVLGPEPDPPGVVPGISPQISRDTMCQPEPAS
jgi:CRISPR-associated endonuclease Cas1